jgi:hypothetical protein
LPQELRQLGDVRRDPPRLVFAAQLQEAEGAGDLIFSA